MDLVSQIFDGNKSRKRKFDDPDPQMRFQANARERDRTYIENEALRKVRSLIPTEPPDRKLSKIEVLRLAVSYIEHLQCQCIAGPEEDQPCVKLTRGSWPESRIPVCTFCLSSQKKFFHRPEPQKLQPPRVSAANKKKLPSNKKTFQNPSFSTTTSLNPPWLQQTPSRLSVATTAIQDIYRFPNSSTDPCVTPSIGSYTFPPSQTKVNVGFPHPYYDRYPTLQNILQATALVPQSRRATSSTPFTDETPERSTNILMHPISSSQSISKSPLGLFSSPYSAMNDSSRAVPLITSKNGSQCSREECCTTYSKLMPHSTPVPETEDCPESSQDQYYSPADSEVKLAPIIKDNVKTYVTSPKDGSSFSTMEDLSQNVYSRSAENDLKMSTTVLQEIYHLSSKNSQEGLNSTLCQETVVESTRSEPVSNPSSYEGDNSSVGATDPPPSMVLRVSGCTCQLCQGYQPQLGPSEYVQQSALAQYLDL